MNHVGSSVNLHIIKDSKILLMRRISSRWMDGKLQIPGGHTEAGESPMMAVIREAREELGINITPDNVQLAATVVVKDGTNEYFALQFTLKNPEDFTYEIMEKHKCSELVWADIHNMPDDTIDIFKSVIQQAVIEGQTYVELGY